MNTATIDQITEPTDKALAAGVLKQAAADLRRFHNASSKVGRELYRDAYTWLITDDFSWPYSFLNVCTLLNLCPDLIRTDLLENSSLGVFKYWTKVGCSLFWAIKDGLSQKFAGSSASEWQIAGHIYQ